MYYSHFSPFVFTQTLLPLLIKTSKEPESDVRIVSVRTCAVSFIPYHQPVPSTRAFIFS